MKITKITAPTMPEAMAKLKKAYGSEAVILYTRNVKKKQWFGMRQKNAVEVVAGIEQGLNAQAVNMLREKSEPIDVKPFQTERQLDSATPEPSRWKIPEPEPIQKLCQTLSEQGVGSRHVEAIGKELLKYWYSSSQEPTEALILQKLNDLLAERLSSIDFSGLRYNRKGLILVGPTGVGKTTTAAKLASKAVLDDGKTVGFITTDTYRIAAVEQLKTYAKILNVPVAVAYNLDDFKKALTDMKDKDFIIVDSAGRNYQQSRFVMELKTLIPFDNGMETHLVLSATAKPSDLSRIIRQFQDIPIDKCLFTKVDETAEVGSLLHVLLEHGIGVSYFTNGQNVPDDLMEAEKDAFIRRVIEGVTNG